MYFQIWGLMFQRILSEIKFSVLPFQTGPGKCQWTLGKYIFSIFLSLFGCLEIRVCAPGELLVPRCVFCSRVIKADAAALFAHWDCGLLDAYFCWMLFLMGGLYFCTLNKQKMFRHVHSLIPIKLDESPTIFSFFFTIWPSSNLFQGCPSLGPQIGSNRAPPWTLPLPRPASQRGETRSYGSEAGPVGPDRRWGGARPEGGAAGHEAAQEGRG